MFRELEDCRGPFVTYLPPVCSKCPFSSIQCICATVYHITCCGPELPRVRLPYIYKNPAEEAKGEFSRNKFQYVFWLQSCRTFFNFRSRLSGNGLCWVQFSFTRLRTWSGHSHITITATFATGNALQQLVVLKFFTVKRKCEINVNLFHYSSAT